MQRHELEQLVAGGESERLEFKRSTGQRTEAAKTVCAMLNGAGGVVLFGVSDRGEIIGQQVSTRTTEEIVQELRRIEPAVFPDIETVRLENGNAVLVLRVAGGSGPYTYDGRPYRRHGPTTSVMPRGEYERQLLERLHPVRRWENEPVPAGVGLADLDQEEIQRTVDNAIRLGRLELLRDRALEPILRGLGLIAEDRLLNAAVVLYGTSQHLQVYYPQCAIRLARFRGRDRLSDFTDNRQYWGHAFALLYRAESFLLDHVPVAGRVVPGKMVREDRPLYPPRATREAIANALCHRDYGIPGGAVAVAMYDDHLEITNPGALHFGLTPEKLVQPHASHPWNPIIAGVLYRAGIIEQWGTGTLNILAWCREGECPDPTWTEQGGAVWVTFYPARWFEPEVGPRPEEVTPEVAPEVTPEVARLLPLCQTPRSRRELQHELGLRDDDHFREAYLLPAIAGGYLTMTIPDKPRSRLQRYVLTEKGRTWLARQIRHGE